MVQNFFLGEIDLSKHQIRTAKKGLSEEHFYFFKSSSFSEGGGDAQNKALIDFDFKATFPPSPLFFSLAVTTSFGKLALLAPSSIGPLLFTDDDVISALSVVQTNANTQTDRRTWSSSQAAAAAAHVWPLLL